MQATAVEACVEARSGNKDAAVVGPPDRRAAAATEPSTCLKGSLPAATSSALRQLVAVTSAAPLSMRRRSVPSSQLHGARQRQGLMQ